MNVGAICRFSFIAHFPHFFVPRIPDAVIFDVNQANSHKKSRYPVVNISLNSA